MYNVWKAKILPHYFENVRQWKESFKPHKLAFHNRRIVYTPTSNGVGYWVGLHRRSLRARHAPSRMTTCEGTACDVTETRNRKRKVVASRDLKRCVLKCKSSRKMLISRRRKWILGRKKASSCNLFKTFENLRKIVQKVEHSHTLFWPLNPIPSKFLLLRIQFRLQNIL